MDLFLTFLSGIGWMIVYEECIRLGFKEKKNGQRTIWENGLFLGRFLV